MEVQNNQEQIIKKLKIENKKLKVENANLKAENKRLRNCIELYQKALLGDNYGKSIE